MYFKPKKFSIGDTWQYSDGHSVHAFFMQGAGANEEDLLDGSIGHAVSEDMLQWQVLPAAIQRGLPGSWDEQQLWTGCTIRKDDTLYLFYTSRCKAERNANSISVATSEDGITWTKYDGNPIIRPDPRYYYTNDHRTPLAVHSNIDGNIMDCRDLCVVYDEEKKHYWGYFAVRRPGDECTQTSVIALAKSYDMLHWEQLPPCFCPDKYHCIETPDVFKMGDKWYMLCLSGNHYGQRNRTGDPNMFGRITIYGEADAPEGPYRECRSDNILVGSMECSGHCAKTVLHQGVRYLIYTQTLCDGGYLKEFSMSPPKVVEADESGRLFCKWYKGIEAYYTDSGIALTEDIAVTNTGRWSSFCPWVYRGDTVTAFPKTDWAIQLYDITADNFVIETTIQRKDALSAGVIFDVTGDSIFDGNKIVLLDFMENEVWLTQARNFPKNNARCFCFDGDTFHLKVLVSEHLIEIYVNDIFVVHHMVERHGGKIGLFAETGEVSFINSRVYVLKQPVNE